MHRLILASAALALTATTASAQSTANAPVTATIISTLGITATGTTNFGNVSNTPHQEVLNPVTPGAGKSAAVFSVISEAGRSVAYSCASSLALAGPNAATMTFSPLFATGGTQASAVALPGPGCAFATLAGVAAYNLYLGGSLNVVSGLPLGSYSGTYTVSVAY